MSAQLPVRHRSTRWLKRRRRATFRRRTFRQVMTAEPILWAIFGLMLGCAVVLGWFVVLVYGQVR